jgi:hypothetical protein
MEITVFFLASCKLEWSVEGEENELSRTYITFTVYSMDFFG